MRRRRIEALTKERMWGGFGSGYGGGHSSRIGSGFGSSEGSGAAFNLSTFGGSNAYGGDVSAGSMISRNRYESVRSGGRGGYDLDAVAKEVEEQADRELDELDLLRLQKMHSRGFVSENPSAEVDERLVVLRQVTDSLA